MTCAEGQSSYSVRVWVLPTQPQQMRPPLCLSKEPLSLWSPETSVYRCSQNELLFSRICSRSQDWVAVYTSTIHLTQGLVY